MSEQSERFVTLPRYIWTARWKAKPFDNRYEGLSFGKAYADLEAGIQDVASEFEATALQERQAYNEGAIIMVQYRVLEDGIDPYSVWVRFYRTELIL